MYDDVVINELFMCLYSISFFVMLCKVVGVLCDIEGEILFIEGVFVFFDYIVLCENGVWDKGGLFIGVEFVDIICLDVI